MGDPHDEVSIQEFFDKLTPDMLLHRLVSRLCMEEEDVQAIEARFEALRDWLLPVLSSTVSGIQLYGSVTRRTRLTARFDPSADVDCLLVLETNLFLDRYVLSQPKGTRPELLWAEDIYACLRQSPEFDDKTFTFNPPYLSIRSGSDVFELTMSTGTPEAIVDPQAIYGIFGSLTQKERAARQTRNLELYGDSGEEDDNDLLEEEDNSDEMEEGEAYDPDRMSDYMDFERRPDEDIRWNYENTTESVDPISPDGRLYGLNIMTQPFFYNGLIEQYSELYGDYWRYLILLWKYWLKSCDAPFPSYYIEDNVFRGLQYTTPFESASDDGDIDFLHFAATYFGNRKLYDHKQFESDPSFCNFRDSLIRADNLFRTGSRVESLDVLSELFEPWEPNWHGK